MCGFLLKTYKKICANDRRLWTNCRNHNTDESRWEREREWEGPRRERKEGNWRERYSDYDLHMVLSARWMITNCPQLWSDCHHPPLPPSSLFPWDSLSRTACGVVGGSDKNPSESIYWIMQFVKRLQLKIVVSFSHLPGFYWMIALS